jgi:hypothetical protein
MQPGMLTLTPMGPTTLEAGPGPASITFSVTTTSMTPTSLTTMVPPGFMVMTGCTTAITSDAGCTLVVSHDPNRFGPDTGPVEVRSSGAGSPVSATVSVRRFAVVQVDAPDASVVFIGQFDGGVQRVGSGTVSVLTGSTASLVAGERPGCTFTSMPPVSTDAGLLGPAVFPEGCQWKRACQLRLPRPDRFVLAADRSLRCSNFVFVSRAEFTGSQVRQADSACRNEALDAGVSSGATVIALVNLDGGTRLVGATGFVRADGMPVASAPAEFFNGSLRAPIALRADGTPASDDARLLPWTGYLPDAGVADRCSGWTSASNSTPPAGAVGAPWSVNSDWISRSFSACGDARPVFCVVVDSGPPLPTTDAGVGRLAFVIPSFALGPMSAASACQSVGNPVKPGSQFAPLLVNSTGGWLVPFDAGVPWYRVDGVEVVPGTGPTRRPIFGAPELRAPLNRTVAGNVVSGDAWMGNNTQTCTNWTVSSGAAPAFPIGQSGPFGSLTQAIPCNTPGVALMCLEE